MIPRSNNHAISPMHTLVLLLLLSPPPPTVAGDGSRRVAKVE
jgi:hypothetical protein